MTRCPHCGEPEPLHLAQCPEIMPELIPVTDPDTVEIVAEGELLP